MTWDEWNEWFLTLYGIPDGKRPTVAAWITEVFVPGGATADELHAAARNVARAGPPAFLNEILPALLDEVRRARVEELLAREDQERRGGLDVSVPGCVCCDGTGWAIVPHVPQPEAARLKGYLATCAVSCKCIAGVRIATVARTARGDPPFSLEQYERRNPDWLAQRREHERRAAAEGRIGEATKGWGGLVDGIRKRIEGRARR